MRDQAPANALLRFRCIVNDEIVDETWTYPNTDMVELADRHFALRAGSDNWRIEMYDPDLPEDQTIRYGTRKGLAEFNQPLQPLSNVPEEAVAVLTDQYKQSLRREGYDI